MDVVIAQEDALRTFRMARAQDPKVLVEPTEEAPSNFDYGRGAGFASVVLPELAKVGIVEEGKTVHLRFPSYAVRCRNKGICPTVTKAALPPGSFWRVVPTDRTQRETLQQLGVRLFVDSPALCLLWQASRIQHEVNKGLLMRRVVPLAQTMGLASELCGKYSLDPLDPNAARPTYGIEPLVTAPSLQAFLDEARGIDGIAVARRALTLVAEGQGSPAEVALWAALTLRPSLGGFHFERPTANVALDLSPSQLKKLKHKVLTPDIYWSRYGIVLEYDGSDHGDESAVWEDKRRLHDYQALGLSVFPVTAEDLSSVDGFDKLVRSVAGVMERTDGPSLRRRVNKVLANQEARLCRSLLLSAVRNYG